VNTRDKVEWTKPLVRVTQCHKVSGYDYHDKIEVPVIFKLTPDGKRRYDVEEMMSLCEQMIIQIKEHEKNYQ